MQFSSYQEAIREWVVKGKGNNVINAVAGSGKTYTLVNVVAPHIKGKALFCAFNKHIAEELQRKLKANGSSVEAKTIHSIGFAAVKNKFENCQMDPSKYKKIIESYYKEAASKGTVAKKKGPAKMAEQLRMVEKYPGREIAEVFKLSRATLTDGADTKALEAMVARYSIDVDANLWPFLKVAIPALQKWGIQHAADSMDFDDMVWLPCVIDGLNPPKYDFVLVDEVQDLTASQRTLLSKCLSKKGRLLAVGDKNQACYGFAGADFYSFDEFIQTFNAQELPLSICYRCPKSHLRLARTLVPRIEDRPDAPEGILDHVEYFDMPKVVQNGDMIIARITNILLKLCYVLIAGGVKAAVRGRDIGVGLKAVIEQMRLPADFKMESFLLSLERWEKREVSAAKSNGLEEIVQAIEDKAECIRTIYNNSKDKIKKLSDLNVEIDKIFSDDIAGVVLSTVHRAKGLEAERIFILDENLMPFFRAQTKQELEQEYNLRYVALTRSKSELYFVYSNQSAKKIELDEYRA